LGKKIGSLIAEIIEIVPSSFNKKIELFSNYWRNKMSEHVRKDNKREESTLGMAFMGFIMAIAAINGIWFLPVMIKTVSKIVS
jgi:hypothetical protein